MNDNWGLRTAHYFNAQDGRLQEQFYTIYRDLRSWTGALTFRAVDNGPARRITPSPSASRSKPRPKTHVGGDTFSPYHLVGE